MHRCHGYLPCRIVVSKVDKVLHKPSVDFTQREALLRGLQDGLQGRGRERSKLNLVEVSLTNKGKTWHINLAH